MKYKVILDQDHPNKSDPQDQMIILKIIIELEDQDHAHLCTNRHYGPLNLQV